MHRWEMEQEKKLAELEERRILHELESRLAEAQMHEQLERDGDEPNARSNQGDEYRERSGHWEEVTDHPVYTSGARNNEETPRETVANRMSFETHNVQLGPTHSTRPPPACCHEQAFNTVGITPQCSFPSNLVNNIHSIAKVIKPKYSFLNILMRNKTNTIREFISSTAYRYQNPRLPPSRSMNINNKLST